MILAHRGFYPGVRVNAKPRGSGSLISLISSRNPLRGPNYSHVSYKYKDRTPSAKDHIFVAMSSGVDSSTVAALMHKQYPGRVSGIYMCNWSSTAKCTEDEWNQVQNICNHIGIPAERVNFEKDYWTDVFEPMIEMYSKGVTPNPDVSCNRYIKFGSLLKHLKDRQAGNDHWILATGHYAKISVCEHSSSESPSFHLMRPTFKQKDQSYYLSTILPDSLSRIMFPLASYEKPKVRQLARQFGLDSVAEKPDSQGLCFVSQDQRQFRRFLDEYLAPNPGDVVTEDGLVVGSHSGLWHATIGQRSGISMPQGDPKFKGVWYVSDKNIEKNQLVIVPGRDHPSLYSVAAVARDFHWLGSDIDLQNPTNIQAQYRSLQECEPLKSIKVTHSSGSTGSDQYSSTVEVEFSRPRRAVAPGQYLTLYQGDRVLGSGVIETTIRGP